ncbi:hypothetical protein PK35_08990 [Tamlana nanhaiensis]|uniref:Lipoprotein n=1 Tax=Neotamlana nanhaiensis TaxID=1382798 RepID=A0A0D7W301_9FLAO|nr:hypothetical protein [Tamlana nanhaiensis]KJD33088.1 hypothetical protein PK35_08990 [Tamlana nanhaiensis]
MKTKCNFLTLTAAFGISLLFFSCGTKTSDQKDNNKAPSQSISYEYANELEEEFKTTRAEILNKNLGFEDSREFLFSLDSLKRYIAYFEREAQKKGYNNLGLRVYLGAYPESKKFPDPGRATVFFVPTGNKIRSQGSVAPTVFPMVLASENISDIPSYNYGQAGRPPEELE